MPVTLTLKNIPDSIYQSLKQSAEAHRRSLNMEAITVLEKALATTSVLSIEERIERIRRLSVGLPALKSHEDPVDIIRKARDGRAARDTRLTEAGTATRTRKKPAKRKRDAS